MITKGRKSRKKQKPKQKKALDFIKILMSIAQLGDKLMNFQLDLY